MRKAFDIENIDLDGLIETVMTDKQAAAGEVAGFKGINFGDLHLAYKQFCKHERISKEVVNIGEVIEFFNRAAVDLPDHTRLKGLKLPQMSTVLDGGGAKFAELFEPDNRRQWVPLAQIPESVQKAFIAAEDKRFYDHTGVDVRSVTRAFMNTMGGDKRQGGSTITQQVAKNLLVGDNVTFERKIREVLVATRLEKAVSKPEILEIYLNSIYLGRSSWGVDLAARAYFGKPIKDVNLTEAGFLAGLTKGPAYFNPDKYLGRAQERLAYVLTRMKEDGSITAAQLADAEAAKLNFVAVNRVRRDTGFHLVDEISREARAVAGITSLTTNSYQVRSTIRPSIQRAAESALQEGLAQYEQSAGRVEFQSAEANIGEAIRKLDLDRKSTQNKPSWQVALEQVRLPLYDVHWTPAVVVEKKTYQGGVDSIRVGIPDGRVLPISTWGGRTRSRINQYDVVYVKVVENSGQKSGGARAELRSRPHVQGIALVMDNKTGRMLAMVGGFSYPMSQLNRVTQSRRQPGSSLKPLVYLAALSHGLQPNTLILDASITYPPINGVHRYTRSTDYWSPRNYDGGSSGTMTLRRALEQSKNLVTARLLDGGIGDTPQQSLDAICQIAVNAQIYPQCVRFYPFVLGAQPVRPIDLAAFYGAIANEGRRPTPHVIEQISIDGRVFYKANESLKPLPGVDAASVFQLRTILQGVVARGTAARLSALSNVIAGKTGTSDDFNDAWFMGFSNDVTIGVWVGYDNTSMKTRKTLGHGNAGSRVALPIFESIMKAVWADYAPQVALPGPTPEAGRRLIALPIDVRSGARIETRNRTAFVEYFRLDESGRLDESQYRLVSRGHEYSVGDDDNNGGNQPGNSSFFFAPFFSRNFEGSPQPTIRNPDPNARRPSRNGFPAETDDNRGRSPFGFFGGRSGGF
jgi:membrane carboxypeptidase/penicillin-binding protein